MMHKKSAKHLADALYATAEQNSLLDVVYNVLNHLNNLVKTESQFRAFVQSKRIKREEKAKILNKVMGDDGYRLVAELISHFHGSQARTVLSQVVELFNQRYKSGRNIMSVIGTISHELGEEQQSSLKSNLELILGKNTDLYLEVDESLIGGIKLRIENIFLDGTIKNQLRNLHRELIQS